MKELVLIDSKNSLFRHAHVHNFLSREDGFPTGALYGCLTSMLSIHTRLPDAAIVWVWDGRGETWRHKFMQTLPQLDTLPEPEEDELESYPDKMVKDSLNFFGMTPEVKKIKAKGYKAQRHHPEDEEKKGKKPKYPETPRERALLQIPVLKMILEGMGIRNFEVESLECDDLISMLAKRFIELEDDSKVYINSGDRDFYQLLAWPQVRIITKMKEGKLTKIKAEDVLNEYGVSVEDWVKYRALTGDSSDNVPHLKKVGSVRAKHMLEAGIDPSQAECKDISDEAREQFGKYFPGGMERMWPALHGNYKLCKLVCDPDDKLLSRDVREKLFPIFDRLIKSSRFYRHAKGKSPEAFRRVSFSLTRYELASILARRSELWEIP
jgi:5'-3' exonuclease